MPRVNYLTVEAGVRVIETGRQAGVPYVIYERTATGGRWRLSGICNRCGLCYIGAAQPKVFTGPPGTPDCFADALPADRWFEVMTPPFQQDMADQAAQTPTATVAGCAFTLTQS